MNNYIFIPIKSILILIAVTFVISVFAGVAKAAPDPTVTLTAYPNPIIQGQPITLKWSSTNAASCTASGSWSGVKKLSGDESLSPTNMSIYTISCSGTGAVVAFNDSVTVNVIRGAQFYVDGANGNDNNPGTFSRPWRTINKANKRLMPGQTVFIRKGTYKEHIRPARSGKKGKPITFAAYNGDNVTITTLGTSMRHGVNLNDRSYIIIDGFTITETRSNMIQGDPSNHNIIRNNYIHGNSVKIYYGINLRNGGYNRIQNNKLANTTKGPQCTRENVSRKCIGISDLIRIHDRAHHNLIENNDLGKALHVGLNLSQGSGGNDFNIIRNNTLHNEWHSNLEVDEGHHTLIDNNMIIDAGEEFRDNPWIDAGWGSRKHNSGIQMARLPGDNQILRRNVWKRNGKLTISNGTRNNLWYHNVIYDNFVMYFSNRDGSGTDGNIFKNNIIQDNAAFQFENNLPIDRNFWINNNIVGSIGNRPATAALATFKSIHPDKWNANITKPSLLTKPQNNDFTLQKTSELIDAGAFLTTTTHAGSGKSMQVADARYFVDGFGIIKGDVIQLASGRTARIVSIDYPRNRITLNRSISWGAREGVSLPYNGAKPDIGAFEHSQAQPVIVDDAYTVFKTTTPISIDGNLREFNTVPGISLKNTAGSVGTYKLLWDEDFLYISTEVRDNQLNATISEHDGRLFRDDSIELMFDTHHNHGTSRNDDFKFFVNLLNAQRDFHYSNLAFEANFDSHVSFNGTNNNNADDDVGYVIELRIRWSSMEVEPNGGLTLGFDVNLNDIRGDGSRIITTWTGSTAETINDAVGWGDIVLSNDSRVVSGQSAPPMNLKARQIKP